MCSICSLLNECEMSYSKYGSPEASRPLPHAAEKLTVLKTLTTKDPEKTHVRRCPLCGTLYRYLASHEYFINGSEDEEELTRMNGDEASVWLREEVCALETLRTDIELYRDRGGGLGDWIDHGSPSPAEIAEAMDEMRMCSGKARELTALLNSQVAALRRDCPEIPACWARAHEHVCLHFMKTLPKTGEDAKTARYAARTAREEWRGLPGSGESFISAPAAWLPGYADRLKEEIQKTSWTTQSAAARSA